MLWLALGGLTLFVFLGGLRAFERASVTSLKSLFAWTLALAGISLAVMLVLTGREGVALAAATLFGPLVWERWRAAHPRAAGARRASAGQGAAYGRTGAAPPPPPRREGPMSREDAYAVLGLKPGASVAEIRAAHRRLMRGAHPDGGGSDWLAARINQARDILLGTDRRRGWG